MGVDQIIAEQLLRNFETRREWLLHDSLVHGVDHMARVLILQELICDKLEAQNVSINREALRWASSTHDVGRTHDGIEPDHGRHSAQWIRDNLSHRMSPETLDTVTYIVHWHVPPDDEAPVMTTELKILKDADALDRVRLGDLNVRYLRTEAARSLVTVAKDLLYAYDRIDSDDTFDAAIKAAQSVGVVDTNLTANSQEISSSL